MFINVEDLLYPFKDQPAGPVVKTFSSIVDVRVQSSPKIHSLWGHAAVSAELGTTVAVAVSRVYCSYFKGNRGVPEAPPGFAIKSIKPKKMFKNLAQLTRIPCSTPET